MSDGLGRVEFGGPDLAPRRLRDLLQDHVDRAASGSRIDWATYYFRDRALAKALMQASDRGVKVRVVLEPRPRRQDANDQVITMLQAHGLEGGFHLRSPVGREGMKGHLHTKIYAFSDPAVAWIGSFNPSGDEPDDPDVTADIGDQDRGHNLLLGIQRPKLIQALRRQIDDLIDPPRSKLWRRLSSYGCVRDGDTRLYFYPRIATRVVEPRIALMHRGGEVRAAISHLKKGPLTRAFQFAAKRGAKIRLLVHDTNRRVGRKAFSDLQEAGVDIRRVADPDGLPMHAKFLLINRGRKTTAWLGSYNFNDKSRLHNAELLLKTTDRNVVEALSTRFEQIQAMA